MDFELYKNYKSPYLNLNVKVGMLAGLFAIFVFLFDEYFEEEFRHYLVLLLLGLWILSLIVEVYSFFSKYESEKSQIGILNITEERIDWNRTFIEWRDIVDVEIQFNEVDNSHRWNSGPKNNVSDGINKIRIVIDNGDEYLGYYKVESETHLAALRDLLKKAVFKNGIGYNVAKKFIQIDNYEEHQALKKQLKNNK